MAASPRAFRIELYEEHLEEASFLFEQRRTFFSNPEITWKKIGEFEERLEAHIDALIVGDKLALEVCKRHASGDDFGELFAATSVFCRQNQRDAVLAIFDQLDPADAEKAGAIADALKYELPEAWSQDFLTLLASGDPKLAPILARAFGYRRVPCGPQLLAAMKRCAAPALPEIVWALGRIGYESAINPLLDYLKSEDEPVRSAAAVALARMGESSAVDYCLDQARRNVWPMQPLGLAGGRRTVALLTERAKNGGGPDCFTALGLLGDPVSVPLLIASLERPDAAVLASTALQCITGAALAETVFVPDEVDEGESADRGDGRPFGSKITRLSQAPDAWNRWWLENGARFTPGVRYRNGGPLSPERLVEMLAAEDTPHVLRESCFEELVTRYSKDIGLEPDTPAARQSATLAQAAAWSRSSNTQFQDGAWYFAGHRRE